MDDDLTLQEALQTDEVKTFMGGLIQESLAETLPELIAGAVKTAIEEQAPAIRESVREEVAAGSQVRSLHAEALRLIEASPLTGAAKANLVEDYGIVEKDDNTVAPGRALALIEAETDADGAVTKSAKAVLREAVEEDIKRVRNVLSEARPTIPRSPSGGDGGGATVTSAQFGGKDSAWASRLREKGLDPEQFGATPEPDPAPAA
jgi:hypothetical protein